MFISFILYCRVDVAIDEELFNDDELEGLDDELEDLDVNS